MSENRAVASDQQDQPSAMTAAANAENWADTPATVGAALRRVGYVPHEDLATALFLAVRLNKPLLLEGDPGVGKTSLAAQIAQLTGGQLIRLQCYTGLDAAHTLYDWDFPKQILHIRTLEAQAKTATAHLDAQALDRQLHSADFLVERPVLKAIRAGKPGAPRPVLLIDEIDRSDDEFDALLLEVLDDWSVTIPEMGTVRAEVPPLVVMTSNRTRELHDALRRRCLYQWLDYPSAHRETEILGMHVPAASLELRQAVVDQLQQLRRLALTKQPGTAEAIDWLRALMALGVDDLSDAQAAGALSALLKDPEDIAAVEEHADAEEPTSG